VVSRFSYNSQTHQYYVVCDLGLTGETRPNPGEPMCSCSSTSTTRRGFSRAFEKYVRIYPSSLKSGWPRRDLVAHADLDPSQHRDFGIKYHETGNSRVYAYDTASIATLCATSPSHGAIAAPARRRPNTITPRDGLCTVDAQLQHRGHAPLGRRHHELRCSMRRQLSLRGRRPGLPEHTRP